MAFQSPAGLPAFNSIPRLPGIMAADILASGGSSSSPAGSKSTSPWIRFSWQAAKVPGDSPLSSAPDLIRPATRDEGEDVLGVILLSLSMDSSWNDSFSKAEAYLRGAVGRLFNAEEPLCLVMQKGNRLIAASLLDPAIDAVSHLVSGPAVIMEYRNRGIGSKLLHASLLELSRRGLASVSGITRDKTVVARHVYPKFGSIAEQVSFSDTVESSKESKS